MAVLVRTPKMNTRKGLSVRAFRFASLMLGLDDCSLTASPQAPSSGLGWIGPVSLAVAAGLLLIAQAQLAGMYGTPGRQALYALGVVLMAFPVSLRVAWPGVSRSELLLSVSILGIGLYGIKILHSPLHFAMFDEFLHWVSAQNVMESDHLFIPNALLPISPLYPGLEILTTALTNLSGLSIFAAGVLVIGIARVAFLYALFVIAELLTGSFRVAALACVVFMANSNFAGFQALFAYESLAFIAMTLAFLAALRLIHEERHSGFYLFVGAAFAGATVVTHHLASYFCAGALTSLAALCFLQAGFARRTILAAVLAAIAVTGDLAWWDSTGGAGSGYLGPFIKSGFEELLALITSKSARVPFSSAEGGLQLPLWQKWTGLAGFLLTCLGLATGFFRSLNAAGGRISISGSRIPFSWRNSGLVFFTLLTLAFPVSVLLRFTQSGWEIGNRMSTFVSLGVCIVVAIAIAGLWQGASRSRLRATLIAVSLTIMVVGGVGLAWGLSTINHPYRVGADAQSIEPMGIGAATWSRKWLGPGQRFAADRINQILLATYGRQIPTTTQQDGFDISGVVFASGVWEDELGIIKNDRIDYLMVDLRLSQALPILGVYFEPGEDSGIHAIPPEPTALLKFNKIKGISRPFDNGAAIVYDVRYLHAAH